MPTSSDYFVDYGMGMGEEKSLHRYHQKSRRSSPYMIENVIFSCHIASLYLCSCQFLLTLILKT